MADAYRDLKMSLRLWSDTQDLSEIVQELSRPTRHHYKKGEAVQIGRRQRTNLPKRHYVSYPESEVRDFREIEPWLEGEFDLLERSELSANLIRNGTVEAVLWIAVFANRRVEPPPISGRIVERARSLGIKIFVENYSSDPHEGDRPTLDEEVGTGPGWPTKTWYPAD